jgi:type IV secretory pathway VirB2 component (pilin)
MKKAKITKPLLGVLLFLFLLIPTAQVMAGPLEIDEQEGFGRGGEIPSAFGESGKDPQTPTEMARRIINIILGFLGLLTVCFLLYAGFVWMTAAGDSGKTEKAMGIIKTCIIGLVIIFAAWSISYFVITKIDESSGGSKNIRII